MPINLDAYTFKQYPGKEQAEHEWMRPSMEEIVKAYLHEYGSVPLPEDEERDDEAEGQEDEDSYADADAATDS